VKIYSEEGNSQFATNTKEKFTPRLCALASSEIHGGIIELINPIPMPAITLAQMNMFAFWLADIRAPPRIQNKDPSQTPFLRPYLSPQ
jgi:hypothetical protein